MKIISKFYNEELESIFARILYFFNTIDTYFILVGISSFVIVFPGKVNVIVLVLSLLFALITAKIADFYPSFVILAIPVLIILGIVLDLSGSLIMALFIVNTALFFIIQFVFMGIPDSIVARDIRVAFIKIYNSLFTVAPTTVSFSMSVFFSFYVSFCIAAAVSCRAIKDYTLLGAAGVILFFCALLARSMRPKNLFSKFHKPDVRANPIFKRVVILNIDGVRKDVFDSLNLPAIARLTKEGTSHAFGLETVYRALTNPAFASIFTGTIPSVHGVRSNNFGQSIVTEGLPDIVPSIAYGSMHVKHFCKKYWQTRIVSLPRHSVYLSDDIMVDWLKDDMLNRPEIRLFVADFSEADFLAHAYGSKSRQYKEALQRIDKRIGDFIDWMKSNNMSDDTAVIVCSDHGIAAIDHSYLIADSERYVPFLIYGKGIKKGFHIQRPGTIMDICCTVAYFLGIRYPYNSRGQVFTEALEDSDLESEKETFVSRFNQLKYDAEAEQYHCDHVEIYAGDAQWWDQCISKFIMDKKCDLRVLDIGCGNGFVGERFVAMGVNFSDFVCMDISKNILEEAKKTLGKYPGFSFTTSLDDVNGTFDIITASSVFHHVVHPDKLADIIDRFLAEDGIVIGSHEPNKEAFKKKLFYAGAALYKGIGGSISISNEVVREFNDLLRNRYPNAPGVCREEILQMVEYHSPLEQYDKSIDLQSGFIPDEFCKLCFPGYKVLLLETYSTFSHRLWLSKHKRIQSLLVAMFNLLFKRGNLFRFVLRKKEI
ncbi:alkaline phosphatase family protein [bacterium]|nr:alkaline phosphatase family protein [bacterium]